MLVTGIQRGIQSKVYPDAAAHYLFAVYFMTDGDGRVDVEKGDHNSAEGFEWRPCVDCAMSIDCLADLNEVQRVEDLRLNEIRDDEGV